MLKLMNKYGVVQLYSWEEHNRIRSYGSICIVMTVRVDGTVHKSNALE